MTLMVLTPQYLDSPVCSEMINQMLFNPFPAIGSSHPSLSSSERMSSPVTDPVYSSSTSAGAEERMLHSVTDGTLAGGMESSSFHAKAPSSPGPSGPALVEQGRTANASTSSGGFTGLATETVFVRSAKIPTSSSFQNNLTSELVSPALNLGGIHILLFFSMLYINFSFITAFSTTCGFTQGDVSIKGLKIRPHTDGELFQKWSHKPCCFDACITFFLHPT